MTRISRPLRRRVWWMAPLALSAASLLAGLLTGLLAGIGVAQDAETADVPPSGTGEGWYWKSRPEPVQCPAGTPPECNLVGDPLGQNDQVLFANDHLYVGWDPAAKKAEMVTGLNFDLGAAGVAPGSRITRFVATVHEHPRGPSNGNPLEGDNHNTVNPEEAAVQGIIACPWPEFLAGSAGSPIAEAPGGEAGRRCEAAVPGVRAAAPLNPAAAPEEQVVAWTFDLTTMAASWAEPGVHASFSLEPATEADKQSLKPWVTAFHAHGIAGPDGQPGVVAAVAWEPPAPAPAPEEAAVEPLPAAGGSFALPSFGGSTGLASELAPAPRATTARPPARAPVTVAVPVGPAEGKPARFWDLRPSAWLAAGVGFAVLAAAGWVVQADAAGAPRPAGAVGALMARAGSGT